MQIVSLGGGNIAPSFAALSASSLPGMFRWPGTQRTRMAPREVYGSRSRSGHLRAISWNSEKTPWEELVKGPKSQSATSKLSKNTHMSVASLAKGALRAPLAPSSTMDALALKTSAWQPKEKALRSIFSPY